jgi:hypothetical protein
MGVHRDTECQEIDLVKEMAEALGSTGIRLEEILDEVQAVGRIVAELMCGDRTGVDDSQGIDVPLINEHIRRYNRLVDKAEDVRRWLLIQREACGFRIHRDVDVHYPVPPKIKLITP